MSWYRIKQIAKFFPAFTENSIRNRVADAEINGLWPAVKRSNTSIYIHGERFSRWIEDNDCLVEELKKKGEYDKKLRIFKEDLRKSREIYKKI